MVKNLHAMLGTRIRSLGQEDALEKEMATYFSVLTWKIPWTEEFDSLRFVGLQRVTELCWSSSEDPRLLPGTLGSFPGCL